MCSMFQSRPTIIQVKISLKCSDQLLRNLNMLAKNTFSYVLKGRGQFSKKVNNNNASSTVDILFPGSLIIRRNKREDTEKEAMI